MPTSDDFIMDGRILERYIGSDPDVVIPEGTQSIGQRAFMDCKFIKSVTIPGSITDIQAEAFRNCVNIEKINVLDLASWCVIAFETRSSNPFFPAENADLYINGVKAEHIVIPEGVPFVNELAFFCCRTLRSVTFPGTLEYLVRDSFRECYNLESITLSPEGDLNIDSDAFLNCDKLKSVTVPKGVSFCIDAFDGSSIYLKDKTPEEIQSKYGFKESFDKSPEVTQFLRGFCLNYEKDGVSHDIIRSYAGFFKANLYNGLIFETVKYKELLDFALKQSLLDAEDIRFILSLVPDDDIKTKSLLNEYAASLPAAAVANGADTLPLGEILKKWLFIKKSDGTVKITAYTGEESEVECPASLYGKPVTELGVSAFEKTGITSVHIPATVTEIGENAFKNCKSLEKVEFAEGLTKIKDEAFSNCFKLLRLNLPNTLTEIGFRAFSGCRSLIGTNIPDRLSVIKAGTFADCCGLEVIFIPDSVNSVEIGAFSRCQNLKTVIISGRPRIENKAFGGCALNTRSQRMIEELTEK